MRLRRRFNDRTSRLVKSYLDVGAMANPSRRSRTADTDTPWLRFAVALASVLLLTAGCLGGGGGNSGAETASTSSEDASADAPPAANSSEDGHEHEPQPERHYVNVTGEVEGTSTGFGGINHHANETVAVPEGAHSLAITVEVEGGELDVGVLPPECTNEPEYAGSIETSTPDCQTTGSTTNDTSEKLAPNGGTFRFAKDRSEAGNWTVDLGKDDAGVNAVSYAITAVYVDVHEPAPGHHE